MSESTKKSWPALPDLGEQVRQWRMARKMTQADLEIASGLSHNTVSRIECGIVSPRLNTIENIAGALNISVEQLQFQSPPSMVAEPPTSYGESDQQDEFLAALDRVPETKRKLLIRTFMDLIRITLGENDG